MPGEDILREVICSEVGGKKSAAFRLVVLVGGGVCIDAAELPFPTENGFRSTVFGFATSEASRHVRFAELGFGEDDNCLEGSTGGSGRLGLGER